MFKRRALLHALHWGPWHGERLERLALAHGTGPFNGALVQHRAVTICCLGDSRAWSLSLHMKAPMACLAAGRLQCSSPAGTQAQGVSLPDQQHRHARLGYLSHSKGCQLCTQTHLRHRQEFRGPGIVNGDLIRCLHADIPASWYLPAHGTLR